MSCFLRCPESCSNFVLPIFHWNHITLRARHEGGNAKSSEPQKGTFKELQVLRINICWIWQMSNKSFATEKIGKLYPLFIEKNLNQKPTIDLVTTLLVQRILNCGCCISVNYAFLLKFSRFICCFLTRCKHKTCLYFVYVQTEITMLG